MVSLSICKTNSKNVEKKFISSYINTINMNAKVTKDITSNSQDSDIRF